MATSLNLELTLPSGDLVNFFNVSARQCEFLESIYGSRYSLGFADSDTAKWAKLASDWGKTALKFTWESAIGGTTVGSPPKTVKIEHMTAQIKADIVDVNIVAVDMMASLQNRAPQKIYKDKTISEIVQEIADDNELESDVENLQGDKMTLYQCGMTDYDFVKDVLIPRSGKEPVLFYMEDGGRLIFKRRKKEKAMLNFKQTVQNSATDYPYFSVLSAFYINATNYGTKIIAFDPVKKQQSPYTKILQADDNADLPKDPFPSSKPSVISVDGNPARIQTAVIETLDLTDELLKSRVNWKCSIPAHRTAVFTIPIPDAQIGDTATLEAKTCFDEIGVGEGAGGHLIYAVYHTISGPGDLGSIVFLERRGIDRGDQ